MALQKKDDPTYGHPTDIQAFYSEHPSFAFGPVVFAGFVHALQRIPAVTDYIAANNMTPFGIEEARRYTVHAILLSYGFHGWCVTYTPHHLKIQSGREYSILPKAQAVRSTATLLTSMVYYVMPMSPSSTSWFHFAAWTAALAIYWDFHFYWAHRWAHENRWAYKFLHKTHRLVKEPSCFGAYFVTFQSHVLLEHLVVLMCAMAGLPKDVFMFYEYWGTLGT
jgi:hypothetical protein